MVDTDLTIILEPPLSIQPQNRPILSFPSYTQLANSGKSFGLYMGFLDTEVFHEVM